MLALLFGYVPGLRQWFEALDGVRKAQVMVGLLLPVSYTHLTLPTSDLV